jgi:hypothetical protein
MKRNIIWFLLLCISVTNNSLSQEQPPEVIKVKKNFILLKSFYNYDSGVLNAIDKYGNLHEDAILSFKIKFSNDSNDVLLSTQGNKCTLSMLRRIEQLKSGESFTFTEIEALDQGVKVKLPDHTEVYLQHKKK